MWYMVEWTLSLFLICWLLFTFRSSTTLFTLVHKTSNLNHTLIKRKVLQRLPPDGGSRTPTQRPELLCAAESMFIFFFFQKQTTLRRLGNNNNKTARSTARLIEAVASLRTGGDSSRIISQKWIDFVREAYGRLFKVSCFSWSHVNVT